MGAIIIAFLRAAAALGLIAILSGIFARVASGSTGRETYRTGVPNAAPSYVTDKAGVLGADEESEISDMLAKYESKTGNQMAVLLIRTTGDEPIEKYSYRVASKWGVGKKGKDNGILITIATDDHTDRIEVGKGLESDVTDSRAGRILRSEAVTDAFRKEEWNKGVKSIIIQTEKCIRTSGKSADEKIPAWIRIVSVLFMGAAWLLNLIFAIINISEHLEYRRKHNNAIIIVPVLPVIMAAIGAVCAVVMKTTTSTLSYVSLAAINTLFIPLGFIASLDFAIDESEGYMENGIPAIDFDHIFPSGGYSSGGSSGGSGFGGGSFGGGGASGSW